LEARGNNKNNNQNRNMEAETEREEEDDEEEEKKKNMIKFHVIARATRKWSPNNTEYCKTLVTIRRNAPSQHNTPSPSSVPLRSTRPDTWGS
jgi:hypothetical protein